jgi:hypothetical protein
MKKIALTLVACGVAAISSGQASAILQDSFPTNGALVGTTPEIGGIWTSISGTVNTLNVVGNSLLIQDDNTEDAASAFTSVQSGDVFASFTINLSSLDAPSSSTGEYFAAFSSNLGSGYSGRLYTVKQASTPTGEFQLAVGNGSSATTGGAFWAVNLTVNTTYNIVMKFTQNALLDTMTLWVNPADSSSTSVTTAGSSMASSLASFAFRQASTTGDVTVDDLKVGTTFADVAPVPEPGTVALIGLGLGVMLFGVRRRA